jgi:uncharacterized protein (DUF58 family)
MSTALSPAAVAAIDDLELAARLVVEGLRAGGHRSPFHGYSAEFQQHRPYRAGDDLKYLDWKLLARTDRLYSRQFRETTSLAAMVVLDTSSSMEFPEDETTGRREDETAVSKLRYATVLAASLAYLIAEQGDAVGLLTSAENRLSYVPSRGGKPHLRRVLAALDRVSSGGSWDPARSVARAAELLKRRGVVVVISDFYDAEEETRRELRRAARRGHDVAMIQVVSPEEAELSYGGDVEFEDLESHERRRIDVRATADEYRARFRAFLDRCEQEARRDGIDYALFTTAEDPGPALRRYLLRRAEAQLR